jgi:cyclohexadienyl dehydratase
MRFRPLGAFFALFVVLVACACTRPRATASGPAPRRVALQAGTSGNYPPLSAWPDRASRPTGFAPELVEAFARHEGRDVAWSRFRWPELATDLVSRRFTLAADGITVRPERSIAGRFTVPIARGGALLLIHHAAHVEPLDRPALRIAVNRGGHLERVARSLFHAARIEALAENGDVRDAFARGDVDAAMTNTFEAPRWAAGVSDVERIGPLTNDVTALWLRADDDALEERLDTWLVEEEESGRLGALRTRALGPGAGALTALPVSALVAATTERLMLMPLVAQAKQRLGKPIEDAAQEERVLAAGAEAVARAAAARGVPPPPRATCDRFFRAQIEAAKAVQAVPAESSTAVSLDDLRAAIARITARMAFLVVRVPRATTEASAREEASAGLLAVGLDEAHVGEIAAAIAAFGGHTP